MFDLTKKKKKIKVHLQYQLFAELSAASHSFSSVDSLVGFHHLT